MNVRKTIIEGKTADILLCLKLASVITTLLTLYVTKKTIEIYKTNIEMENEMSQKKKTP